MTLRRPLGVLMLLAMMHFIFVGTDAPCSTSRDIGARSGAQHGDCAPASHHQKGNATDRATEQPCCAALASCANAPLIARISGFELAAPALSVAGATSERVPRADIPAPELPPPRA